MAILDEIDLALLTDFQKKVLSQLNALLIERNLRAIVQIVELEKKGSYLGDCYVHVEIPERRIEVWAYSDEIGITVDGQFSLLERTRRETDSSMISKYFADLEIRL